MTGENFESKLRARMDKDMTLDRADADGMKVYTVHIQADSPEDLSLRTTKFLDSSAKEEELTSSFAGGKSPKKQLKIRSYFYEGPYQSGEISWKCGGKRRHCIPYGISEGICGRL